MQQPAAVRPLCCAHISSHECVSCTLLVHVHVAMAGCLSAHVVTYDSISAQHMLQAPAVHKHCALWQCTEHMHTICSVHCHSVQCIYSFLRSGPNGKFGGSRDGASSSLLLLLLQIFCPCTFPTSFHDPWHVPAARFCSICALMVTRLSAAASMYPRGVQWLAVLVEAILAAARALSLPKM